MSSRRDFDLAEVLQEARFLIRRDCGGATVVDGSVTVTVVPDSSTSIVIG